MNADFIYGSFCVGAALITMWSVRKAWIDESAGGISVLFPLYFAAWSAANLLAFSLATAPVSFIANLFGVAANLFYVYVVLRNQKLEKVSDKQR